jgi:hypothetical protein
MNDEWMRAYDSECAKAKEHYRTVVQRRLRKQHRDSAGFMTSSGYATLAGMGMMPTLQQLWVSSPLFCSQGIGTTVSRTTKCTAFIASNDHSSLSQVIDDMRL